MYVLEACHSELRPNEASITLQTASNDRTLVVLLDWLLDTVHHNCFHSCTLKTFLSLFELVTALALAHHSKVNSTNMSEYIIINKYAKQFASPNFILDLTMGKVNTVYE